MNASSTKRTGALGIGGYLLLPAIVLLYSSCDTTPTAPSGSDAFTVFNIAVYDGEWKDPQFAALADKDETRTNTVIVHAIRQSPHDRNTLIVAGDYDYVRTTSMSGPTAGLTLYFLTGGYHELAENHETEPPFFYQGGPYTDAVVSSDDPDIYFAGGEGEVGNLENGLLGPIAIFDDGLRTWRELHEGLTAGSVLTVEQAGKYVYVGGTFNLPFGISNISHIFRYDITDSSITGIAGRMASASSAIETIELIDGGIIVGGSFNTIGGVPARNIARWNGGTWEALGDGLNGYVRDIQIHGGALYAAGRFYTEDERFGICARLDGAVWTIVGPTFGYDGTSTQNHGHALVEYKGGLILGGRFQTIGSQSLNNVAILNDDTQEWLPLNGGGVNNINNGGGEFPAVVDAFAVVSDRLYVGGRFDRARVK